MGHVARRAGFSLVELMVVVGIIGVLAVCVAPALSQLSGAREEAAIRDVERLFTQARTRAMGTGEPTGVTVDTDAGTLQLISISGPGKSPAPAPDASGGPSPLWVLEAMYPGVKFGAFTNGDGQATGTVWFAYDGTPQIRGTSGEIMSNFGVDGSLVVGSATVYVRKTTGLVERGS